MLILEKAKGILVSPWEFFRKNRQEKGMRQAFLFSLLLTPVSLVISMAIFQDSFASAIVSSFPSLPYGAALLLSFASGFIIGGVVTPFIMAAIYHVFALALRGKGSYSHSYRAAVYSSLPTYLLGWVFYPISLAVALWSIALSVVAFRELHSLSTPRAFVVAIMPFIVLFLLAFAYYMLSFYSGQRP